MKEDSEWHRIIITLTGQAAKILFTMPVENVKTDNLSMLNQKQMDMDHMVVCEQFRMMHMERGQI